MLNLARDTYSNKVVETAKKYLTKLLKKVNPNDISSTGSDWCTVSEDVLNRLRDMNLLLHLQALIPKSNLKLLCDALVANDGNKLPVAVAMSLEMIKNSLEADDDTDVD